MLSSYWYLALTLLLFLLKDWAFPCQGKIQKILSILEKEVQNPVTLSYLNEKRTGMKMYK
jgi:hypothetical protein